MERCLHSTVEKKMQVTEPLEPQDGVGGLAQCLAHTGELHEYVLKDKHPRCDLKKARAQWGCGHPLVLDPELLEQLGRGAGVPSHSHSPGSSCTQCVCGGGGGSGGTWALRLCCLPTVWGSQTPGSCRMDPPGQDRTRERQSLCPVNRKLHSGSPGSMELPSKPVSDCPAHPHPLPHLPSGPGSSLPPGLLCPESSLGCTSSGTPGPHPQIVHILVQGGAQAMVTCRSTPVVPTHTQVRSTAPAPRRTQGLPTLPSPSPDILNFLFIQWKASTSQPQGRPLPPCLALPTGALAAPEAF